ncbi:MAG TPA: AfsR/SARP family transcriptional regulator [Streptosporangiaceae bacterium]
MEFRILGPLYADAGTGREPAVIGQPLLQSALAVLLLRANRTCPRAMLIEALWGNEAPSSPEAALRVCISRLRRCLGDCAGRLATVGPPGGRSPAYRQQRGYVMAVRPGELDVDEFTDLAEQGQAELDSGNATAAAASFIQALALWGDPPLPDVPRSAALAGDIARLTNHRRAVMDALIDARLAAGEQEQVLGQLRAAVVADPGRERACEQLMRACHALGLHKEALDVYQLARRVTLEQQGAEPGPALTVLYRRILAEETATAGSATRLTELPAGLPVLGASQVPGPPPDFTGRRGEIATVAGHLSGAAVPVTVVSGAPGMGKSALAAAAAFELRSSFVDGQLYAELGGVERPANPHDVLAGMLQTMGIPARSIPAPGPARSALYRSMLAGRNVLVIADDAATAAQVRPLLPAPGGAAVLVTSRGRLTGLAGARFLVLGGLPDDDALTLLGMTAGLARIAAEPAAARAIVAACAGLPLALRLAGVTLAARPGLSMARLASELGSLRTLDVLAAEDISVRAAIGSSYRALSSSARAALRTAAATGAEIDAAELARLSGGDGSVISQLLAVGLLVPVQQAGAAEERYSMHPLIRAFALERARDSADRRDAAVARPPGFTQAS